MEKTYSLLKEQITVVIETLGAVDLQPRWSPYVMFCGCFFPICLYTRCPYLPSRHSSHHKFYDISQSDCTQLCCAKAIKTEPLCRCHCPNLEEPDPDVRLCNCHRGTDLLVGFCGLPLHWCKILMAVIRLCIEIAQSWTSRRTGIAARAGSALQVLGRSLKVLHLQNFTPRDMV